MSLASEGRNVPTTWDWAITGGVVGALIGAAWGIVLFQFVSDSALLLIFMAVGLAAGVAGGTMMNLLKLAQSGPTGRFFEVVTIGAVSGAVFGVLLFLFGSILTCPSGAVGGAFTYFLVRYRWFRRIGAVVAAGIAAVGIWQLLHGAPP